jgi:hypothetical protein
MNKNIVVIPFIPMIEYPFIFIKIVSSMISTDQIFFVTAYLADKDALPKILGSPSWHKKCR